MHLEARHSSDQGAIDKDIAIEWMCARGKVTIMSDFLVDPILALRWRCVSVLRPLVGRDRHTVLLDTKFARRHGKAVLFLDSCQSTCLVGKLAPRKGLYH